nr:sigma 54-interacting transcriptional regulator [uncultured Aminipila sp.]
MFTKQLEFMSNIYDHLDALLITNNLGIIEYSSRFDSKDNSIKNEGYSGKHILVVYPSLTEETSSHFRVIKTGEPILDEKQTLIDLNGHSFTFLSSTYPIEYNNEIIGAIEGSMLLSMDGVHYNKGNIMHKKTSKQGLFSLDDIITNNSEMKALKEKVRKVAKGQSSVMIIGETGTGKELIAQSLHTHSTRNKGPFISQNCSAIPVNLLESILFGTVKGGFTGAEDRKGLFEMADQGTLFLDELNSMDISLQGKILKVLEDKHFRRIGSDIEKSVDVRIISAMNQDPIQLINKNELRKDLFYRLGVVQVWIPMLRKRREDIPILTEYFINHFNQNSGGKVSGVSEIVEKTFVNYDWPGNVRELRNAIEYAFNVMSGTTITLDDIPENILYYDRPFNEDHVEPFIHKELLGNKPLPQMLEEYEKLLIKQALEVAGTVTNASKLLGTSRQALQYKVMKYRFVTHNSRKKEKF